VFVGLTFLGDHVNRALHRHNDKSSAEIGETWAIVTTGENLPAPQSFTALILNLAPHGTSSPTM